MKADIQAKFDALTASQNTQTTALADITNTVHAAETLLDGLVASSGGGATTDADVLAALDAVKQQLDAKNAEIAALKDELAAKVVADTPA